MRVLRLLGLALMVATGTVAAAPLEGAAELVSGSVRQQAGFVVAGADSAELRLPGGARVVATPGSEFRIAPRAQQLQLDPGKKTSVYTVVLRSGRVDVSVPAKSGSAVIVSAPRTVSAIVKSGRVAVSAQANQVATANYEGETIANVGGMALTPVKVRTIRVVDDNGESDRAVVAAPAGLHGQRLFMTGGAESVSVKSLSWDAPQGAVSYRLELFRFGEQKPMAAIDSTAPSITTPLPGLEAGVYRVSVMARDAFGFASPERLESSLHVVSASLPQGAYVDAAGSIRVVPGARVHLFPIEGLEMTYTRSTYMPATSTIGINRNQPATMFLRPVGADQDLPIRFVPRSVRARIEIGPKRPSWPNDPLKISIKLEDPSGQPIPEWLEMMPKVRIGLLDIDVDFRRVGQSVEATLPPRRGPGPWVVRVDVEDQYGYELGRDFVEIAASAKRSTDGA